VHPADPTMGRQPVKGHHAYIDARVGSSELFVRRYTATFMNFLLVSLAASAKSGCITFADLSDWTAVDLAEWQTLTISPL
jgi:hypothetical protein